MSDLYLIAHKVRGQPAFDCAERMECPECQGLGPEYKTIAPCTECDSLGYWWIVGTSGHRAYPWWDQPIDRLIDWHMVKINGHELTPMPDDLPDHYHHTASPANVRARLEDLLSAMPPTPTTPFKRRF